MTTRERVRAVIPDDADGVVLESSGAVSWYLGGARVNVPLGGPSVVAVLVTRDDEVVRCHGPEAARLADEENVRNATSVAWADSLIPSEWRHDPRIRSERDLEQQLRAARASLTEHEADRYRALGTDVAAAMTSVATCTTPARTERSVAGDLANAVYSLGAEPVVLLVAGASRLDHRHPLPTAAPLGDRAMLVVGARRHGLIVNLTRWVRFGRSEPDSAERIRSVEADVLDATVPGAALSEVFATLRRSYVAHGFGPDEWLRHHQGGPTGYFGRDPKATPDAAGVIVERQAFAWNPSAPGVKAEDTVLATRDGVELLTHDPSWPSVPVAGRARPVALTP